MKTRTLKLLSGLVCALALAAPQHSAQAASTKTITFASGTNWRVYKSDPASGPAKSLGLAQAVCLTSTIPVACPTGALIFDYPAGPASWDADLSPIPGAVWVWAPKITAQSLATSPSELFFSKKIKVSGTPLNASLSIALDAYGEVFVNGTLVGTHGSLVDINQAYDGQHRLATFDIAPYLVKGQNIITLKVQNDSGDFSPFGCVPNCTYAQDPAGAAFGGQIIYTKGGAAASDASQLDDTE